MNIWDKMIFLETIWHALKTPGAPSILLFIVCIAGLMISGILALFWQSKHSTSSQIFGTLLVVCLALKANNTWVYAISIFIIATLITRLDFLENLAAIAWGRKEVWNYRKATIEEVREKRGSSAISTPKEAINTLVLENSLSPAETEGVTELKILAALTESGLFQQGFDREMTLVSPNGTKYILDAVGHRPEANYIIEIKVGSDPQSLASGIIQLKRYMTAYRNIAKNLEISSNVRGLLVRHFMDDSPDTPGKTIAIIKFNPKTGTIENIAAIKGWMELSE